MKIIDLRQLITVDKRKLQGPYYISIIGSNAKADDLVKWFGCVSENLYLYAYRDSLLKQTWHYIHHRW